MEEYEITLTKEEIYGIIDTMESRISIYGANPVDYSILFKFIDAMKE